MKKGKFVIISGPSGVGKDTICDELVKKGVGRYSVSMTTRKKRSNEIEGISYFFVSKEEFERHIEERKEKTLMLIELFKKVKHGIQRC